MTPDRAAALFRELLLTPPQELSHFARRNGLDADPSADDLAQAQEILQALRVALMSGSGPNWERIHTAWGAMRARHGEIRLQSADPQRPGWVRDLPDKPTLGDPAPAQGRDGTSYATGAQAAVQPAAPAAQPPAHSQPTGAQAARSTGAQAAQPQRAMPATAPHAQPPTGAHAAHHAAQHPHAAQPPHAAQHPHTSQRPAHPTGAQGAQLHAAQPHAAQPHAAQPHAAQPQSHVAPPAPPPPRGQESPRPSQPASNPGSHDRQPQYGQYAGSHGHGPPQPGAQAPAHHGYAPGAHHGYAQGYAQPAPHGSPSPQPAGYHAAPPHRPAQGHAPAARPSGNHTSGSARIEHDVATYAAFCAACAAAPQRTHAIMVEYGVMGDDARERIDDAWQDRFDDDEQLHQKWEELLRHYRSQQ